MQAEDQEDFENATSVELDDDESYVASASDDSDDDNDLDDDSTRTNVREDDEELDKYSKKVDKRIKKLTAARRQAEEEAAAAVQYIQQVQAQNEQYKQRLSSLDKGYMSEYEGRITTQESQAKRAMTEAYEAGDYEKVAEAQSAISQIAIEKERLRMQKQRSAQEQAQEQQQAQQPQQRQVPARDLKLEAWMSKNTWFGPNGDKVMTGAARAIHNTLVAEEGFDPTSDYYYAEIDRRMRREMPNKFQADRKNVQAVTPAGSGNRTLKSGRKKQVELNAGQVALAQKLNIPLEKYAAEVAKIANRRN